MQNFNLKIFYSQEFCSHFTYLRLGACSANWVRVQSSHLSSGISSVSREVSHGSALNKALATTDPCNKCSVRSTDSM